MNDDRQNAVSPGGKGKRRFESHAQWAAEISPQIQGFLEGREAPAPHRPLTEAWLTYSAFVAKTPITLQRLIEIADAINIGVPDPDEIGWALLQLRKRRWLFEGGGLLGLTAEGYRAVGDVVGSGGVREEFSRLCDWVATHPV